MYDSIRDEFTSTEPTGQPGQGKGDSPPANHVKEDGGTKIPEKNDAATTTVQERQLSIPPHVDETPKLSSPPVTLPPPTPVIDSKKRSRSTELPQAPKDSVEVNAVAEGDRPTKKPRSSNMEGKARIDKPPMPLTDANLMSFSRKKVSPGTHQPSGRSPAGHYRNRDSARRRSRSPDRRSPARRRERSPVRRRTPPPPRRSPTPPPRSPPRRLKRPGGAARISNEEQEELRRRREERDKVFRERAQRDAALRGVHDVVREHYNAVPERGREWRKTDSRIRGLRSFNNWVKSAVIQKFSVAEDYDPNSGEGLKVLDIGCGKGGDLGKWENAPYPIERYIGLDPADVSIKQAQDRFRQMSRRGQRPPFQAEFFVKDCFGEFIGDIPEVSDVGIDGAAGPGGGGAMSARWGGGGFDVVSMMFCMHYAFENEEKTRGMLRNVAGSLKKGGRLIGTIPNSDIISEKVVAFHDKPKGEVPEWGNSIYRVKFPQPTSDRQTPKDGIFRPPFGWKYSYFLEEAVEEVPEYVVPWEAFRGIAEDYNLELLYKKPFAEVWEEENEDEMLGPLSERMNVRERNKGPLKVSKEEMEAAGFYIAFCFYKT